MLDPPLRERNRLLESGGFADVFRETPISADEMAQGEHAFRSVARKLEIPDALKLYCARHTFGTVAMAETKNPGLVKEVMGHESLTTTMGYLHPETAQIKVVIDRLNQQKSVM